MKRLFTYDTTYETEDSEGNVTGSLEVRFKYAFTPRVPARIRYDEHDHPAEGSEIDVHNIHVEVTTIAGERRWFDASREEYDMLLTWAEETLWEAMEEEAIEADANSRAENAAAAYEARREMMEDR